MKIKNKLLINNLVTSLVGIITLSIIISIIISNYIRNDYKSSLIKENEVMSELLDLKSTYTFRKGDIVDVDKDFLFKYKPKLNIINIIIENSEKDVPLLINPFPRRNAFSEEIIANISKKNNKTIYDVYIDDELYLGYNNTVEIGDENEKTEYIVISLVPNHLVKEIINRIIIILVLSIFIISTCIFFISSYTSRKITKPIEKLKIITEKIANKKYNKHIQITTGDEIESLANSINDMSDSINEHDEKQREFYRNVSHDLKTPLTVISGYAEGIKTGILDDNNKALDTIVEECSYLKKQLENMIYLSKLDSMSDYYNFSNTSINELIEKALKKVESIIILNEIDIIYEPINDYILNLDGDKIVIMLINVLSNCLKNTKDMISIKTESREGVYKILITDNGKGFMKEFLDNPFDLKHREKKEVSGIGMSIIKRIVEGHMGNLVLENNENKGAKYIIEIPHICHI